MKLSEQAILDFNQHALRDFPKEAAGVVVDGNYIPCTNVYADPCSGFTISSAELGRIVALQGPIQAILHSHPKRSVSPSAMDQSEWMASGVPWGIVSTDGENVSPIFWMDENEIAPIEGRTFIHGHHDCYGLVRDYLRLEAGITIPNYVRPDKWWDKGHNLYEDNFAKAGFHEIPLSQVSKFDVLLIKVRAPVVNHAAICVGPDTLAQHFYDRLSGFDGMQKWRRCVVRAVRHADRNGEGVS